MHSAQSQCPVHLHFFDDFNGKVIYGETVSLRLTFAANLCRMVLNIILLYLMCYI